MRNYSHFTEEETGSKKLNKLHRVTYEVGFKLGSARFQTLYSIFLDCLFVGSTDQPKENAITSILSSSSCFCFGLYENIHLQECTKFLYSERPEIAQQ